MKLCRVHTSNQIVHCFVCFHIPATSQIINYFHVCRCIEQINKANRGEISQDELQERQVSLLL